MSWLRKLKNYLFADLDLMITPPPPNKVKTFTIKRIIPIVLLLFVTSTIWILGHLYKHYYDNYLILSQKLLLLEGVREENQRLREEIFALNQDTKMLKENLNNLLSDNEKIKNMIELGSLPQEEEVDLQLKINYFSNLNVLQAELPIGGKGIQLFYQETDKLLQSTKKNIEEIKEELPQQKENLAQLESSVIEYKKLQAATPNIWPVADNGDAFISSNFGWRRDPVTGKQEFHEGLDIGIWYNTPVLAAADGVVKYAGWINGYGWIVKIDHGFGFETRYGHLNKIKVNEGQQVKRGQVIALSGNSGRSTGPHLHYEVRKNNIPQDPREYIGR